jgi:hypothetical protein
MRFVVKNKKILLAIILLSCFLFFSKTLALETNWPDSPGGTSFPDINNPADKGLGQMVKYFYEWGITIGGVVTFFSLVLGGFKYLTSMGNPTLMAEAKNQIQSAIFGLILLLSSWLILNTINPDLTSFKSNPLDFSQVPDVVYRDLAEYTGPPCDMVLVYDTTDFAGTIVGALTDDDDKLNVGSDTPPASVRAIRWSESSEGTNCETNCRRCSRDRCGSASGNPDCMWYNSACFTDCKEAACGCSVRLFAGEKKDLGWGNVEHICSDALGDVPAYQKNLALWVDREIQCVGLILPESD